MKFQPGQSGNPGGRKRSLTRAIQSRYGKDGAGLLPAIHELAFGVREDKAGPILLKVSAKDRLTALKLLLEWGYQKPAQVLEGGDRPLPLAIELTDGPTTPPDPESGVPAA